MIATNGLEITVKDNFGRREDLSFIVRFNWKTSDHLKEAIQVLLAARLSELSCNDGTMRSSKRRPLPLNESEFEEIRLQIASNPDTPPAVLAYLARTASEKVLERIAENPRTPVNVLEVLAESPYARVRVAVAENADTPLEVLAKLVDDEHVDVRYAMAENPSMPASVLVKLVADANPYISARASATLSRLTSGQGQVLRAVFGTARSHNEDLVRSR